MAGLLNTLKKNWRGLLDEVQAAPESLRALTQPAAAQQFDAALRKGGTIDKEKAVQMAMDVLQTTPMGVMGKIVYHGSPHKFDKFDMSKIGTGEGAQAYGHGLYLAESPEVARDYYRKFGGAMKDYEAENMLRMQETADSIKQALMRNPKDVALQDELRRLEEAINTPNNASLYKVDIPDEAVSRMLDWDKPLSQQAPEVQNLLSDLIPKIEPWEQRLLDTGKYHSERAFQASMPGSTLLNKINETELKARGITGIRYLDGGSRTAGEGTSNFVLFDDQLPRILERNGTPTGLNPWAPGEWRGLLEP